MYLYSINLLFTIVTSENWIRRVKKLNEKSDNLDSQGSIGAMHECVRISKKIRCSST